VSAAPSRDLQARVVSIGALPAHPLWNERGAVRTGHATTTLIRSSDATILVDPGLPARALVARLHERAALTPADITHVFLTSFHPDATRGLAAFENAQWLVAEAEREGVGVPLAAQLKKLAEDGDAETAELVRREVALLQRSRPAPDSLAPGVDLFPMPGVTPGLTGLLVSLPAHTLLIAGDAIPTVEHLEQGKVLQRAADVDQAKESFQEAVEIADWIIPGRDNLSINPLRRPF
jgi:glyoxylase-like metal-dependent hydrolase (beta-lactamase superfamily II)